MTPYMSLLLVVRFVIIAPVLILTSVTIIIPISVYGEEIEDINTSSVFENEWKSTVDLEKEGSFRLSWKPMPHRIIFLIEAKTRGYVGLGFSMDGRMVKADITVAWVQDKSNKPYLIDCHGSDDNSMPIKDTIQNNEILHGYQNNTHTIIMFTRLWNTCDKEEDLIIGNDTIKIIWALNEDDPIDETMYNIRWHGKAQRGYRSLNLRNPPMKQVDKSIKYYDFTLPNISITNNMATVYWCKVFKAPQVSSKHHIVGYTPIQNENSDLIHHMLLYECHDNRSPKMDQYSSENGFLCYTSQMPEETESCITPIVTWAIGSEGEFFPSHVGMPIEPDTKGAKYYLLEVHYDNPTLKQVYDNSGIRIYYTEKLRKYDAGIFVSGTIVSPLHIIPPYQTAYKTAGYCDKYCTNAVLPFNGINTFSVVLHSHSAAYKMKLRHFRQGEELPPIVQDEHYDFNYQQSRSLPREVTIFPGDELVTECTYNTANRTLPTQGGYSTKQEMCLSYITYYPKVQLASCQSMNPIPFFFLTFGIKEFYHYDMNMIEKVFLKLTDKEIKRHFKTTSVTPQFPTIASGREFDEQLNEAHISALKQMPDYTIDEPEETNLFHDLVISEPLEFQNKTFSQHLLDLPWKEICQRAEEMFYYGSHMTFCRFENDSLALPTNVHRFPNITTYKVPSEDSHQCDKLNITTNKNLVNESSNCTDNIFLIFLTLIFYFY